MAYSLKNKTNTNNLQCVVELEGLVSRKTCSDISIELINYILVQRDQIPESILTLIANKHKAKCNHINPKLSSSTSISKDQDDVKSLSIGTVSVSQQKHDLQTANPLKYKRMDVNESHIGLCGKKRFCREDDDCLQPLIIRSLPNETSEVGPTK